MSFQGTKTIGATITPPFVLRLDLRGGRNLTLRWFKQGGHLSLRFARIMVLVAREMLSEEPYYEMAYVGSDEINLLGTKSAVPFSGRLEKILSIGAGMASSVLTRLLLEEGLEISHVEFDARVIELSREEIEGYFLGRQKLTATNVLNWYLQGKETGRERERLALLSVGPDAQIPLEILLGTILYRTRIPHKGINPTTGQVVQTSRRIISESVAQEESIKRVVSSVV